METGRVISVTGIGRAEAVADRVCIGGETTGAACGYDAAAESARGVVAGLRKIAGDEGFDMDAVEVLRLEVRPGRPCAEEACAGFEYRLTAAI